ncbi:MAG TPA: FecR domain-containing protein [Pyrinomonadaceae bacterium]|nr:FecR domain-containing protein [Pyrinomonadaceae bacterium]
MTTKSSRFDLEWWIVSKRVIYSLVALLVVAVVASGFGLYTWLYGNPFKSGATEIHAPAGARFISFDGDVRVVRAQTRESLLARSDTQLYPGDIVQTQADGRARIQLADGSNLIVRPNSVVTIRDNTSYEGGQRTNVRVAVARGQINVRTEQQPEGGSNIVETPLTKNNLAGQTGASFDVREDNSEGIRVSSGQLETVTRGGVKTTVQGNEYIALNQQGNIKSRESLLAMPLLVSPRDLEKISATDKGATSVTLRWVRPQTGTPRHYRVEVATSPFFVQAGKVTERDQLEATQFGVSDLRAGIYFWRVRAVASSGQISEWTEPQKFTVVAARQGTADHITLSNVAFEYIGGSIYVARGRTQPGNTIRINGRETLAAADGSFQLQISVPKAAREIIFEAEDSQGTRKDTRHAFTPDAGQR